MNTDIAVVGLACRLPGARDPAALWRLLREGRDARVTFADDELRARGVPETLLQDPAYVKAGMPLPDIDQWDAGFFGMSPRDAALMDPQHRVFMEVAWEALEHGGHPPDRFDGRVGVFAGCGMDTYLLHNILTNPDLVQSVGMFLIRHTGNDKDFLATRTSYQFDLRGPSVNVVTACSTSLVAIHQAVQSLLAGECDLALAGGVTIQVPQDRGYLYREGEVLSPDGHCRAFDADARGTVFGNGAGVVALRRLDDALRDGDTIHAVIAGSAVNNDGARKVSFMAPSIDGYAEVVAEALTMADLPADALQYVEAHGTGTAVGDPIEIEALSQAFKVTTPKLGFCGIGSIKTNIGHLDAAAGVAGFLKLVLALRHGELPASLNFRRPNRLIDFAATPFRVVAQRQPWPDTGGRPRAGGVSSLGVGGTNCHVVVKEAPVPPATAPTYPRRCHLLPLSARSAEALRQGCQDLARHFGPDGEGGTQDLADAAWTLQVGRKEFAHRTFAVVADGAEAATAAALLAPEGPALARRAPDRPPSVVFLFPGGGAQHPGMGRDLYHHEPEYRRAADECLAVLAADVRDEIAALLFGPDATQPDERARAAMQRTAVALPALFLTEYALARTLMAWGIQPDALLGHSMGEYVAACLAGVFTVAQAIQVVRLRGELLERIEAGAMVSVPLSARDVSGLANGELSVAASNGPNLCAVAGPLPAIERFERELQGRAVEFQRLHIQVAAHSHLLEPVLDEFRQGLRRLTLGTPRIPFVSNVTGDWIDPERAASADYWVDHLRHTVRFQEGVATVLAQATERAFVEVGPGRALTSLVRMHADAQKAVLIAAMPHPKDQTPSDRVAVEALGRLWQAGVTPDWRAFQGGARRRVPLPTYPFQRKRHWIDQGHALVHEGVLRGDGEDSNLPGRLPATEWFRVVTWKPQPLPAEVRTAADQRWLVVGDGAGFGAAAAKALRELGAAAHHAPAAADWGAVLDGMQRDAGLPTRVLNLLPLDAGDAVILTQAMLALQQALGRAGAAERCATVLVTHGVCQVGQEPIGEPAQAAAAGFGRVVPREFPGARWQNVDLDAAALRQPAATTALLAREAEAADGGLGVLWRDGVRFVGELGALAPTVDPVPLREQGVYLLVGGLGGLGLALAEHLARTRRARLVLVGRRGLPERAHWPAFRALRDGDPLAQLMARIIAIEELGAEVAIVAADVTTEAGAAAAVRAALDHFGALHGVFHLAGVIDDGPIQVRTPERLSAVLRPKVTAVQALDRALATVPLDFLLLFASISGLAGIPGQCDYAAGNAFLDAFARQRQARGLRTVAVDWGVFRDAGMALANADLRLRQPDAIAATALLGTAAVADGGIEFASTWDPRQRWQLDEHRLLAGGPVLPGMAYLELATAAVRAATGLGPLVLRQVEFRSPMVFADERPRELFVQVRRARDGLLVTIRSAAAGQGAHEHERVTHARLLAAPQPAPDRELVDVASLRAALAAGAPPGENRQLRHVRFGPRWDCVRQVSATGGTAHAELRLPPAFADDLAGHPLHPALLDMAFGCAVPMLDQGEQDRLHVPVGCEEVRVHGRLAAAMLATVRLRPHAPGDRFAVLDVALCDPNGIPLLELRGLQLYGVRGGLALDNAEPAAATAEPPVPPPPPRPRVLALLPRGLAPAEGMEAIERALACGQPQVVVSSVDVERTAAWLSLPPDGARRAPAGASAAAENADASAGDQPRDDTEKALALCFEELLGVVRPGIDLDFFELGGHSLLAVRLFARIQREHALDLEIATLLRAPTIRKLAVELRERLGLPEPGSEPVRSVSARRGQHLVPIHTKGPRPNLFLAHGAGGNVLGFRELSHYLGADQPVYGLQARGVDGRSAPHETVPDMARDYLAEIREVQPHGPYFLGGYSGGGCIAYEMARQLRAIGEQVPFVGMIDTPSPHQAERSKVERGLIHLRRLMRNGPLYPWRILKMKLGQRAAYKESQALRARGQTLPQDLRGHEMQNAFDRAFFRYQVEPYDGEVVLFRAEHEPGTRYRRDRRLGWGDAARGGMVVVDCPGDHMSMCVEPNVQVLCARYREQLDRAIAARKP